MQLWYPARSTPAAPPLQHPTCSDHQLSVDFCVLLLIGVHLRPTPLPWLYFWCVEFVDPNKGTSSGESDPNAARILRTHREWRLNDLGVWRTLRQRYRAKLLGGRTVAAHLVIVMYIVYFLAPIFVYILYPSQSYKFSLPKVCLAKKVVKMTLCTTGGVQLPQNTPINYKKGYQNSSVWYNNGRIFKITPGRGFKNYSDH